MTLSTRRPRILPVFLAALLPACGGAEEGEGPRSAAGDGVHYELVAEFGTGPEGPEFHRISGGFLLDEETLVIADGGELELWIVDLPTKTGTRIGGRGEGPGEFSRISRTGRAGDSIWVSDRIWGRVTFFAVADPSIIGTATIRDYFFEPPAAPEGPSAVLADGRFLFMPGRIERRGPESPGRIPYDVLAASADGSPPDTLLGSVEAPPPGVVVPDPGGGFLGIVNFLGELPLLGLGPRGDVIGLIDRFGGSGPGVAGTLHLARLTDQGWSASIHRIPGASISGSRAEVERRVQRMDIGWPTGGRNLVETLLDQVDVPEWISPVGSYRIDGEGHHWVGLEEEFRGERDWLRGDPVKDAWDQVVFDRPVEWPLDAAGDRVAAVLTDPLGVQTVGIFRRAR